ncbi:hypothetical protein JW835_16685 [bacterium]|nr:hypothetical protein [bacterium]
MSEFWISLRAIEENRHGASDLLPLSNTVTTLQWISAAQRRKIRNAQGAPLREVLGIRYHRQTDYPD